MTKLFFFMVLEEYKLLIKRGGKEVDSTHNKQSHKETLDNILFTKNELLKCGFTIENNIIERIDVNCIGHFGNTISFEIICKDCCPYSGYDNSENLGTIVKAFLELFDISEEDGIRLSKIKNIPCRIIINSNNRICGFGHFMKDKFVFSNTFSTLS